MFVVTIKLLFDILEQHLTTKHAIIPSLSRSVDVLYIFVFSNDKSSIALSPFQQDLFFCLMQRMLLDRISGHLTHLSRWLVGELLVNGGIRRPFVRRRRREHFQTTSSLKPLGRFFSYFIYSIYR